MELTKGQEMAKKFTKDFDGEELAKQTSNFVNNFTFDKEGFIKEMIESENEEFLTISLLWIIKLKAFKTIDRFDARNEYSVETGNQIFELISGRLTELMIELNYTGNGLNIKDGDTLEYSKRILFVEKMGREHRTLQQSFSELVFSILANSTILDEFLEDLPYQFHRTPMI